MCIKSKDNEKFMLNISKKRVYRGNVFENRRKIRNKVNKLKLKELNNLLQNWYIRTTAPTCALTLLKSKDGNLVVKYSGPKAFESFGLNEEVVKLFSETVISEMKKSNIELLGEGDDTGVEVKDSIDQFCMQALLSVDLLNLGVNEKRKLLTQIITGPDMKKKNNWSANAKPEWWPQDIRFRSPNERKHGFAPMSVHELDEVLEACAEMVKALSHVDDDQSPHTREAEALDSRSDDIVSGEAVVEAVELRSSEVVSQDNDVPEAQQVEDVDCVELNSTCGAGENCCWLYKDRLETSNHARCSDCNNWFHCLCTGATGTANFPNGWKCGCSITRENLSSLDNFQSRDAFHQMIQEKNVELQNHVRGVLTGKIFSRKFAQYKAGHHWTFHRKNTGYYWLIGEEVADSIGEYVMPYHQCVPPDKRVNLTERVGFNEFILNIEVLAFLLSKEERISILRAKQLLSA